jgi:hypothetical protein
MLFYELTHPTYEHDLEKERINPVRIDSFCNIPGIICKVCLRWTTSKRLRIDIPASVAEQFREPRFLSPEQWQTQVIKWASMVGVAPSVLTPGMEIGVPQGYTTGLIAEDVVHPFPGILWATEKVCSALETAGLRGLQLAQVEIERGTEHPVPRLWEIVARGRGRTKMFTQEMPRRCQVCGRDLRKTPALIDLDPAGWDGSDFIIVDENPHRLIVTPRVREVLESIHTSNIQFDEVQNSE